MDEADPARDLAWTLWSRTPSCWPRPKTAPWSTSWQHLLARVGKVLSIPVEAEPLYVLTGAFEPSTTKVTAKWR